MKKDIDLSEAILDCWKTTHQVSMHLVGMIDQVMWKQKVPGYPRKTIGSLVVHLHNVRCAWINDIGKARAGKRLKRLESRKATRREVRIAMNRSSSAMLELLARCIENGGRLPARPAWLNFPDDIVSLLAYFVAHEAHHRGQIIMAARQLGRPFERTEAGGLWQWSKRHSKSLKSVSRGK